MYYFLASLLVAVIGVVPLLLRSKIGEAVGEAIIGFLAALFTYFGVSFLLTGLHSYLT